MANETHFQSGFTRLSPVSCDPDLRRFATNYDSQPMFRRHSSTEERLENEDIRASTNANISDNINSSRGHQNHR